jgi:leader peptidase (prepilin peptidase)/N-methyltransferase
MTLEIYGIYVFILGMIIGSFLNVVIYRFNTGRGLGGRSMCFTCRRTLSWHELVPIVSYINQRGTCRGCKSKISIQYPLVEGLTGIVFVSIFLKMVSLDFTNLWTLVFYGIFFMYMFSLLIVISVYDYHHQVIPDKLVWLFNFLALISIVFTFSGNVQFNVPTLGAIFAGPIIAAPLFFLWLITQGKGMGFGDVKLGLGIGWLLGLASGAAALMLSFWIGAVVSILILLLSRKKIKMKLKIPFGPFMCLATFLVFIFSVTIVDILNLFAL